MDNRPDPKFMVGEQAILLSSVSRPDLVGSVFTLTASAWKRRMTDGVEMWFYADGILVSEEILKIGRGTAFAEDQLGKLPPNTLTEFEDCVWQPKKEIA